MLTRAMCQQLAKPHQSNCVTWVNLDLVHDGVLLQYYCHLTIKLYSRMTLVSRAKQWSFYSSPGMMTNFYSRLKNNNKRSYWRDSHLKWMNGTEKFEWMLPRSRQKMISTFLAYPRQLIPSVTNPRMSYVNRQEEPITIAFMLCIISKVDRAF